MLHHIAGSLDHILTRITRFSRVIVIASGALILISAVGIAADVILRRTVGVSAWGANELSYYALAVSTSWAFAYAILVKAHIRIDALVQRLSVPLRAVCDLIALLGMGAFALMASWSIWGLVARSWARGSTSITTMETPLWIPQGLWFLGFAFFTLVTTLLIVRVLLALIVERSYETVDRYAGSPDMDEDIEANTIETPGVDLGAPDPVDHSRSSG